MITHEEMLEQHRKLMALLFKVANCEPLSEADREYAGQVRRELAKLPPGMDVRAVQVKR